MKNITPLAVVCMVALIGIGYLVAPNAHWTIYSVKGIVWGGIILAFLLTLIGSIVFPILARYESNARYAHSDEAAEFNEWKEEQERAHDD